MLTAAAVAESTGSVLVPTAEDLPVIDRLEDSVSFVEETASLKEAKGLLSTASVPAPAGSEEIDAVDDAELLEEIDD